MGDIEKVLEKVGILPESPIGRVAAELEARIERLEREVLPQEPPPEVYE